jgi:hypothetical protein
MRHNILYKRFSVLRRTDIPIETIREHFFLLETNPKLPCIFSLEAGVKCCILHNFSFGVSPSQITNLSKSMKVKGISFNSLHFLLTNTENNNFWR